MTPEYKPKHFIKASRFVKRQTPDSKYSHFDGSWEELEELVELFFEQGKRPGYRDGVVLVDLPPAKFKSSVVSLSEGFAAGAISRLETVYEPRQEGEDPVIQVMAYGKKQRAVSVFAVLYRWDVLAENDERSQDSEWEIISINASPTSEEVPMGATARARNILVEAGGTDPKLEEKTREELIEFIRSGAAAFMFWARHVMVKPDSARAKRQLQEEIDRLERGRKLRDDEVICHRCGRPCKMRSRYDDAGYRCALPDAGNSTICVECLSKLGKRD